MKYFRILTLLIIPLLTVFFISRLYKPLPPPVPKSPLSPNSVQNEISFRLPKGFTIKTFAKFLGNPRDLQFSPGGTLLLSNPQAGEVIALPDKNGDEEADQKKIIIFGENLPHGLAFYQDKLYVAEETEVVRYSWDEASLTATKEKVLFSLPKNSNHNRRSIIFDKKGNLFVSVGSTCNVCWEASPVSATIMKSDAEGKNPQVFAKGLRNAPFMQFNPKTNDLWVTEMGRDNLGDEIPPDEINIIKQDKDYGWPNCYGNRTPDTNFNPQAKCTDTEPPIYEIPAHSAPLGLTFWQDDLYVAYHGSWNRSTPVGYKVVRLKINENSIVSEEDFLTGFLPAAAVNGPDQAIARPVDLTFDSRGNLYLSDDKTGSVYIIQSQ